MTAGVPALFRFDDVWYGPGPPLLLQPSSPAMARLRGGRFPKRYRPAHPIPSADGAFAGRQEKNVPLQYASSGDVTVSARYVIDASLVLHQRGARRAELGGWS